MCRDRVHLLLTFLSFLILAALPACGGSGNSTFSGSKVSPAVIGAEGGSIRSRDGMINLVIPAGALSANTEIRLDSFDPGIELGGRAFRVYQALPDGLTFAVPATLEARAGDIYDQGTLPLLVSASDTFGNELPANQEVERDLDSGETIVRGSVSHFSTFSVGGTTFTAAIDGVPFTAPADSIFGPIVPSVTLSATPPSLRSSLSNNTFTDASVAPVSYSGTNPIGLVNENGFQGLGFGPGRVDAQLTYNCGDPGLGTFRGSIRMQGTIRLVYTRTVTELTFGLTPNLFLAEELREVEDVFETPYDQVFVGTRVVNCAGSVEETPEPTGEETPVPTGDDETDGGGMPTSVPTAMEEETPAPTVEPEPTAEPTPEETPSSTADLSVSPSMLSFSHSVGNTGCPQDIGIVTVKNTGEAATQVLVSTSTGALSADVANFELGAGESRTVKIIFTCSQSSSFTGTVSFTPSVGGSAASVTVEGNVG